MKKKNKGITYNFIILIILFICLTILSACFLIMQTQKLQKDNIYALEKNSIECTYRKTSANNDNQETSYALKFFSEDGIKKIEYNNIILKCNNKKEVGIDLIVSKNAEVIVTVTTGNDKTEEFPIAYVENVSNITIESGYQKLTDTGIIDCEEKITANILYASTSGSNYYSINNGEWIQYTETLRNLNQNDYIRAKTVSQTGYGESDIYEITIPPSTKLPSNVYDSDNNTYVDGISTSYLLVDNSMKGGKLRIRTTEIDWSYRFFNIVSYDKNMKSKLLISKASYNGTVEIPQDAEMISIYAQSRCRVFTIEPYIP